MKREIKFRGKSISTGEWVYSMTIAKGTIKRKANNIYMEVSEGKWMQVDPNTVGQYTGTKDKNGKEIYDGDIVTDGKTIWAIKWITMEEKWDITGWNLEPQYGLNIFQAEVIGNIHDNPEIKAL